MNLTVNTQIASFCRWLSVFLLLYKAIIRTHSNQRKRFQRCSASFRRQYRLQVSPFRMLCGRHRGFPVMFCFSDVKGNITLCCIAFSRRVSPFPSFPVPAAFSRRAAAFPSAAQTVTAVFYVTDKKRAFPSRKKAFFRVSVPEKDGEKSAVRMQKSTLARAYSRLFPISKPVNPECCTKFCHAHQVHPP